MRRTVLLVGIGMTLLVPSCNCPPPTEIIHVPADYPTIQAAIDAAPDGALVLVADGTYTGPGNKNLHWDGTTKHLTVECENGPADCIIDCEWDGRGFDLSQGQNRSDVVKGFTITHGRITNPPGVEIGGGAILSDGTSPSILDCILRDNIAGDSEASSATSWWTDGGAIDCVNGSSPLIKGSLIEGNYASHTGGGIHFHDSGGSVENNVIIGNVNRGCYGGGGISVLTSNPEIVNNVIANNVAEYYGDGGYGGGILCMNSDPYIVNNTIVGNSTVTAVSDGEGGGIRIRGLPTPIIANCIIQDNGSGPGLENIDFQYPAWVLDISYCDIEGGLGSIVTTSPGTNIDADPLFVDAANDDYALTAGSPCIDAGAPDMAGVPFRLTDLAGNMRISGSAIDIGAYEYPH